MGHVSWDSRVPDGSLPACFVTNDGDSLIGHIGEEFAATGSFYECSLLERGASNDDSTRVFVVCEASSLGVRLVEKHACKEGEDFWSRGE